MREGLGIGVGARLLAATAAFALAANPARAFEIADLNPVSWFSSAEKPPAPRPDALPYVTAVTLAEEDAALRQSLLDASGLRRLREDAPQDGETLVRRAQADEAPLTDAMNAAGYYGGRVSVTLEGAPLGPAAARAAEARRNVAPVAVEIAAAPGLLYRLRQIRLVDGTGAPLAGVPAKILALQPGDPARAGDIRAAQARIVDFYRAQSRPLAKALDLQAIVDHRSSTMDVTLVVAPGPVAGIGAVVIGGEKNVDPQVAPTFNYLEIGEGYAPEKLVALKKAIANVTAFSAVSVREAEALDASGNLPLYVTVTERKRNAIGASARYSTIDGPAFHPFWEDRNLFGGAERLRLEADAFLLPGLSGAPGAGFQQLAANDLGGRLTASFVKPALWGTRNDLVIDAVAARERYGDRELGGYEARYADVGAGIRHRFSDTFAVQGGLLYERALTTDVLGKVNATLIGAPLSARYDSSDNLLDPTRGFRVAAAFTPFAYAAGRGTALAEAKTTVSAYYALDEDAAYVLAGRIGLGALVGPALADIPANHRFYAGGGGSVRGFAYRTLSPAFNGKLTGGRSLFEGSAELRIRLTQSIGIVPFIDAGGAFASSLPDFSSHIGVAAGIGLRYFTPIGPLRLDVAAPLNPRKGDPPVALYLSIGQAF